jgi:nicotinate-nucleotide adenylyltransferase
MKNRVPIGILGGTFDPIHHGHLRIAQEALEQCGLSQVRFVPCGTPPHRPAPHTSAKARWEMVRLVLNDHPDFLVDVREVFRTDPCYTIETLAGLRAELGAKQSLCLILGGDAFLQLNTWHEWQHLFDLAHIVVLQRAGGQPLGNAMSKADAALQAEYQARLAPGASALHESPNGTVFVADMPALEISSTDIRRRCTEGKSARFLVPDVVNNYIKTHKLYRTC